MKTAKPILLLILAVSFLTFSCKKKGQPGYIQFEANEPFELKMNSSGKLKDGELRLTFTGVPEDSRCPKGVNCVWEGQVKVILVAKDTSASKNLEFTRTASQTGAVSQSFGGFKIQLLEVNPYPESDKKIMPDDYKIRLAVRK